MLLAHPIDIRYLLRHDRDNCLSSLWILQLIFKDGKCCGEADDSTAQNRYVMQSRRHVLILYLVELCDVVDDGCESGWTWTGHYEGSCPKAVTRKAQIHRNTFLAEEFTVIQTDSTKRFKYSRRPDLVSGKIS